MKSARNGYWTVPRIWDGTECFILGGGPSLANVDIERLRHRRTIAVNNAFKLAEWIDCLFFGDTQWLRWHHEAVKAWPGIKVTVRHEYLHKRWIHVVEKNNHPTGIQRNPARLGWNLSSGACAINLAVHFGARRIVLLGFDMRRIGGKANWHDDHPRKVRPSKPEHPYNRFIPPFAAIAKDLKNMGIECINATPGSALTDFPIVHPDEVIG